MISSEKKTKAIKDLQRDKKDVGSPEVQVSILTARINELTDHLKLHKGDDHSRRGLLQMVGRRKRLLKYLKRTNPDAHRTVVEKLKLRG